MTDSFNQPGFLNFVVANYSGARPWIADYSGLPIETSLFGTDRFLKVTISGQPTAATLSLSGVSLASNVSGNVVYLTSGQNPVQNSGQVVYLASGFNEIAGSFTANVSGQPVRISGDTVIALISGQTVIANVVTNISGQVVYFASGQNPVQNSGQVLYLVSGQNQVQMSGQLVAVSGLVATSISGNIVNTSGQVSIISGQPVLISGQLVAVSGLIATSVSGNMVSVSGQPANVSGNVVNTSGNVNYDFGTIIRTTSGTIVTSLSGGTELGSGVVINLTVRNISGNAPMYIGGTGSEAPFSGKGMILFGNESQTFDIDNFNKIRLFANTSGQRARVIGVAAN